MDARRRGRPAPVRVSDRAPATRTGATAQGFDVSGNATNFVAVTPQRYSTRRGLLLPSSYSCARRSAVFTPPRVKITERRTSHRGVSRWRGCAVYLLQAMNAVNGLDPGSLLARAAGGDMEAWGALLAQHQTRLAGMVSFRLDPRLRGRVDAGDVVQEAFIVATQRRAAFFGQSVQPLFLWLRWMVGNTLLEVHRSHLRAQMRDPRRELVIDRGCGAESSSDMTRAALVAHLTAGATGPATAAGQAEVKARLSEALEMMDATDREVLALRHFEQLTSAEAAHVLGIQERAAAKRYTRALERLREILAEMPGGLSELRP